uniref:Uncharacterized protein n=1 Tax=Romanomermis culicivorax TaxID=13658 RepID=A0A915JJG2_ROMCU
MILFSAKISSHIIMWIRLFDNVGSMMPKAPFSPAWSGREGVKHDRVSSREPKLDKSSDVVLLKCFVIRVKKKKLEKRKEIIFANTKRLFTTGKVLVARHLLNTTCERMFKLIKFSTTNLCKYI